MVNIMKNMKNNVVVLCCFILFTGMFGSCDEITFGDNFLGDAPESSGATLDTMFNSLINSEKVLVRAYTYLPYGLPTRASQGYDKMNGHILESCTDLNYTFGTDAFVGMYYNGSLNSQSNSPHQIYHYGTELDWKAIRYSWIYLENIDKVPDISPSLKEERKAEAKMILALTYAEMMRNIGGVIWLDHSLDPNEKMLFPRITFAETIDRIVGLLDEAIPFLKWKQSDTDDGRMTKAGAMALKLRALLFAASPVFNSGTPWRQDADTYTCYGDYQASRWEKAKKAGEEFMQALSQNGMYELTQPQTATHQGRREAFRSGYYDRGGTEVLISTRRGYSSDTHEYFYGQRYYTGPTLNYVNMFSWEDGTEFPADFDWENPSEEPFYTGDTHKPTRDPRLYETVCVPGERYFDGRIPPYFREHPEYRVGQNGGFFMMKFLLTESPLRANRPVQWPLFRLSEALLSYAEAINEAEGSPNSTAYQCINTIRARVGLPPLSNLAHEAFREAVLKERAMELGFEEIRWYDLVRWGRVNDFKKTLYGLEVHFKDGTINEPTSFTFKLMPLPTRYWANNWDTKWFLSPIPVMEINKGYGMTQNPGW
jgi:hypothetical protein